MNDLEKTNNNLERNVKFLLGENSGLRKETSRYKQALNIVFGKRVDIPTLDLAETLEDYNASVDEFVETAQQLTKEEFNFLKSVMRCLNI